MPRPSVPRVEPMCVGEPFSSDAIMRGLRCPDCRGTLAWNQSGASCQGCRRFVPFRGGTIPDFLGDGLEDPSVQFVQSLESVADLESLLRKLGLSEGLSSREWSALTSIGVVDQDRTLTPLGEDLAYHLHEFDRQAIEPQLGGWAERSGLDADSRILDIGSGAGQTLRHLRSFKPEVRVGLDLDLTALTFGRVLDRDDAAPIHYVRASAHSLPFADQFFSHVICRVGLNYMHQRRALWEMSRVLRPGGYLFCRVEGPGFDLELLRRSRGARERFSRLFDIGVGIVQAATGYQPTPGRAGGGGRAFVTIGRMRRILRNAGCGIVDHAVLKRTPLGLPTGYELLASRTPSGPDFTAAHIQERN